jgi:hypothetical protein
MLGALAACGEQAPKPVASTPMRTATPSASPAPVKKAGPAERAKAKLENYLTENTQDKNRYCVPADEIPKDAIAAVNCDYRDSPQGSYLLFKSKSKMADYFDLVSAASKPIRGTKCSSDTWGRGTKEYVGKLGLYTLGARTVLIWTDDDARVLGTIRSKTASPRTICGLWRESG